MLEGRNLCRGSTFTQITTDKGVYGGYEVTKLVDGYWFGGSGQTWLANTNANITNIIQFSSAQTFDTLKYSVGYTANLNATPHNVTISVSDNGSDYTVVGNYELFASQPSAGQWATLTIPSQTATYLKILFIDNFGHASRMTLGELSVYKDGTNAALTSTITATTEQAGYLASKLKDDGNPVSASTDWRSTTTSTADDIVIDLGESKSFSFIGIESGSGYYQYWFTTYTIYTSDDNSTWTQIATGETSALSGGVYELLVDFDTATARYIKCSLGGYRYTSGVFCILGEVRVFESVAEGSQNYIDFADGKIRRYSRGVLVEDVG